MKTGTIDSTTLVYIDKIDFMMKSQGTVLFLPEIQLKSIGNFITAANSATSMVDCGYGAQDRFGFQRFVCVVELYSVVCQSTGYRCYFKKNFEIRRDLKTKNHTIKMLNHIIEFKVSPKFEKSQKKRNFKILKIGIFRSKLDQFGQYEVFCVDLRRL